jgi:hypothetical protein
MFDSIRSHVINDDYARKSRSFSFHDFSTGATAATATAADGVPGTDGLPPLTVLTAGLTRGVPPVAVAVVGTVRAPGVDGTTAAVVAAVPATAGRWTGVDGAFALPLALATRVLGFGDAGTPVILAKKPLKLNVEDEDDDDDDAGVRSSAADGRRATAGFSTGVPRTADDAGTDVRAVRAVD